MNPEYCTTASPSPSLLSVIKICQSVHKFNPPPSNDKSFCSCSKDFFFLTSFFTVWVAEQLSTALGNHMVGVKVLHRDVRPFVLRHEAAPDETLLKEREKKKHFWHVQSCVTVRSRDWNLLIDWEALSPSLTVNSCLMFWFFFFFLSAPF